MINNYYKYIKYKNKYFNLLNKLKGGAIADTTGNMQKTNLTNQLFFTSIAWSIANDDNTEILPFSTLLYLCITKHIHDLFINLGGTILHIYDQFNKNISDIFNLTDDKLTFKEGINIKDNIHFASDSECMQLYIDELELINDFNELNINNKLLPLITDIKEYHITDEHKKDNIKKICIHLLNTSQDTTQDTSQDTSQDTTQTQYIKINIDSSLLNNNEYLCLILNILNELKHKTNDKEYDEIYNENKTLEELTKNDSTTAIDTHLNVYKDAINYFIDKYNKNKTLILYNILIILKNNHQYFYDNKLVEIIGLGMDIKMRLCISKDIMLTVITKQQHANIKYIYTDIIYSITNNTLLAILVLFKIFNEIDFNYCKNNLLHYILIYYLNNHQSIDNIINIEYLIYYIELLFDKKYYLIENYNKTLKLIDKLTILYFLLYYTFKRNISYLKYLYSNRIDYAHTGFKGYKFFITKLYENINRINPSGKNLNIQLLISDSTIGCQTDIIKEKEIFLDTLFKINNKYILCGLGFDNNYKTKKKEDYEEVEYKLGKEEEEKKYDGYKSGYNINSTFDEWLNEMTVLKDGGLIVFILGGNDVFNIMNSISIDPEKYGEQLIKTHNNINTLINTLDNVIKNDTQFEITKNRIETIIKTIKTKINSVTL